MKQIQMILLLASLLIPAVSFARSTMSIEAVAELMTALNLTINAEVKKRSFVQPATATKSGPSTALQFSNLKSILISGQGHNHKYVQHNFLMDKQSNSLIANEHLIDSIQTNNKIDIPYKTPGDELLTIHWQQNNQQTEVTNIYSTWLLDPEKSAMFTEKTSALISIRPLISASLLIKGNDFPVRLYHQFGALKGHQLEAIHIGSKQQIKVVSDDRGIAVINLSLAGDWMLMLKKENYEGHITTKNFAFLNFHVKGGE